MARLLWKVDFKEIKDVEDLVPGKLFRVASFKMRMQQQQQQQQQQKQMKRNSVIGNEDFYYGLIQRFESVIF